MEEKKGISPIAELLFIAIGDLLTFTCGAWYLGAKIDLYLMGTFALLSFGIYALNRYTDIEDAINNPEKLQYFQNNRSLFYFMVSCFVVSIGLLVVTNRFTLYHAILISLGIAYSIKMIPTFDSISNKIVLKRLKDIPFIKSLSVSFLLGTAYFMMTMSLYPVQVERLEVYLIMISFTLGIFMNTNFADIRDVVGDKAIGVPTLPVLFGTNATYLYTMVVPGILWLVTVVILYYKGLATLPVSLFFLINLLFPIVYVTLYKSNEVFHRYIQPISDGCVVIYAIGLIALRTIR